MKEVTKWRDKGVQNRSSLTRRQIIIVGANDIGIHLAETLGRENENVILIDEKEEFLQELNEEVDVLSLPGNPMAIQTLKDAGAGRGTWLVTVTESDSVNLLLLLLGENLGVEKGYALIQNHQCFESFSSLTSLSNNLHLIHLWELVVQEVERRGLLQLRILYSDPAQNTMLIAVQFQARHPYVGERIGKLRVGNRSKVVQVIRNGVFLNLDNSMKIEVGDLLIIYVDQVEHDRVMRRWFHQESLSKVMVGGDEFSQVLVKHWPRFATDLVCVERDLTKCQQMLLFLEPALILRGDGLDISLLMEAGIQEADLFIAASENDEVNLLSSLLAKSFGVNDVLTILRKRQHTQLLERLKLDGIISIPQLVVEYVKAKVAPTKISSTMAKLEVTLEFQEETDGIHLIYRGGALVPKEDHQSLRDREKVIHLKI